MKMNGRPRKCSVSQYPPGALPFRLSRSSSRSSIMVWNSPPSTGSTRSKTRRAVPTSSSTVSNGRSGAAR